MPRTRRTRWQLALTLLVTVGWASAAVGQDPPNHAPVEASGAEGSAPADDSIVPAAPEAGGAKDGGETVERAAPSVPSGAGLSAAGPACRAYFAAVRRFCATKQQDRSFAPACEAWLQAVEELERSVAGAALEPSSLATMEAGCAQGLQAMQAVEQSFRRP